MRQTSPPPASQVAQPRVADPLPTPPAMAWTWLPTLPNPASMMCRLCLRTPVGDVPGLNRKRAIQCSTYVNGLRKGRGVLGPPPTRGDDNRVRGCDSARLLLLHIL